jgi:phospholipase D1/2
MDKRSVRGKSSKANSLKVVAFAAFLAVCFGLANIPGVRERLTLEWINAQINAIAQILNRPYGPAIFIGLSILILLLHMPGLLMVVVGALVYGPVAAFAWSWIGANLGTAATFFIARYLLRDYFKPKLDRSFMKNFLGRLEKNGIFLMSFMRVLMFMFPPLNWLMGASDIRARDYMIGNMLGLAPIVLCVQLAVRKMKTIRSTSDLFNFETVSVIIGFLVVVFIVAQLRKKYLPPDHRGRNGTSAAP